MNIIFPEYYDDLLEMECKSKGCALNFNINLNGVEMIFNFYYIVRFTQDAKSELEEYGFFRDEDAVILPKVTREQIYKYLSSLS
ncbi:hypothetical protein [Snodgrassella sp. ESL0324]|uniref:hypothetical protein n=1 Tax=Snodgrassella sp. ESL0324 TaxID=2705033 RepID=UPI0015836F6A|nr:hypothetical protein [Snodgrassella sp. ESL0324]NUF09154.1 hypothetical protein [Snodgrassella sp. ESL0324]